MHACKDTPTHAHTVEKTIVLGVGGQKARTEMQTVHSKAAKKRGESRSSDLSDNKGGMKRMPERSRENKGEGNDKHGQM